VKLLLLLACLPLYGQDLAAALKAAAPNEAKWVGYEVPMQPGQGSVCGWNHNIQNRLLLSGPTRLRILFRVERGVIGKMHLATEDCQIEPGTQQVVFLPNISLEASIGFLATRKDDSSLFAIAVHPSPLAAKTLIEMARDKTNPGLQKKAFFWISRSKDPQAADFIARVLR
jgi:hypothetical protein